MRLSELLQGIAWTASGAQGDPEISGLCFDSRKVRPGDLFVAIKGHRHDGHDHVPEVARAGAAAVMAERPVQAPIPVAVLEAVESAVSPVAARFYGHPSKGLSVVGVTGTNGKTTITYMLERIFQAAGLSTGVIGTIEYRWAGRKEPAPNTTPMAGDIQRILAGMRSDGVSHVAMEVSSHALALGRVEDVAWTAAVFTNLTRDHLDFHKDMEHYFAAKARLFELLDRSPNARGAVINNDDPWADKLAARLKGKPWTYGLEKPAEVTARDVALTAQGSAFSIMSPRGPMALRIPLVGRHNVYNALAAAAAAMVLEVPLKTIQEALAGMSGVPGRLERVGLPGADLPFDVFVDYAHTDDALKNVLQALRPLASGKLLVVFGCGGDRDRTKRPLMGEVAMKLADYVFITSDNPRSEDPAKIALDVEVGTRRAGQNHYEVILDREEAIGRALRVAQPGDVVLLAGKGHETYQIFKDKTVHFDDRETARAVLQALARG
jgi:UDP-N-acetylmuramoyl-L-alanyl-D-glutamate--2,6-diaminopimelate ligase